MDSTTIEGEGLRQMVITLKNLGETLSAKVVEHAKAIQRLREEQKRLTGEQGKLTCTPKKPAPLLSSEQERRVSKAHHQANTHAQINIDQVEVLTVQKEPVPSDAQCQGSEEVIVQDMPFRTNHIRFRKET